MFKTHTPLLAVIAAAALVAPSAATADPRGCKGEGHREAHARQAFAAFGDDGDYWLAPGGDFEDGAPGWSLSTAQVEEGNDDLGVLAGRHSLALGTGLISGTATAVSAPFCVTADHPTFRYTLRANGLVGALSTFVRYTSADGSTEEQEVRSRTATTLLPGQWKPSDLQPLATRLPMADIGGAATVRLVFRTPLSLLGSGYQIDNVMVDPYRQR